MSIRFYFRLTKPYGGASGDQPEATKKFGPFREAPRISNEIKVDGVVYGGQPTGEWWWELDSDAPDCEGAWSEIEIWAEIVPD
jgi:hypothetical protein